MRRPVIDSGNSQRSCLPSDQLAAFGPHQPREGLGQRFGAAAAVPTIATVSPGLVWSDTRSSSRAPLSSASDRLTAPSGVGRSGRLLGRRCVWIFGSMMRVDSELLDHLRVFDLHVLARLIPVDQFLDRPGQILVGGDDRDQLADVELALQRQIAADRDRTGTASPGRGSC